MITIDVLTMVYTVKLLHLTLQVQVKYEDKVTEFTVTSEFPTLSV